VSSRALRFVSTSTRLATDLTPFFMRLSLQTRLLRPSSINFGRSGTWSWRGTRTCSRTLCRAGSTALTSRCRVKPTISPALGSLCVCASRGPLATSGTGWPWGIPGTWIKAYFSMPSRERSTILTSTCLQCRKRIMSCGSCQHTASAFKEARKI